MSAHAVRWQLAWLLILAAVLASPACGDDDRTTVTVFAASSLTDAFEALGEAFEEHNPDVDLRFNFAGSQVLATQLRESAEADVIATADRETMDALAAAGLVQQPVDFTTNTLVVATRKGLESVSRVEDLAAEGLRIAVAAPAVPAGRYARAAIDAAAAEYGAEWKDAVLDNVVSEETNVRAVLNRVESGEADVGFVYRSGLTGLATEAAIGALPLPVRLGLAIVYPAALTARPPEAILAAAFLEFVLSDEGQAILESFGFGTEL